MSIVLEPIGTVYASRVRPDDDAWDRETAAIELDARFTPDALLGLTDFSHIEVIYWLHDPAAETPHLGARRPRGRSDWPLVGIFAQRAKNRPNRIGATVCRLLAIDGLWLRVGGLDAIDGTPVLDIKPWMSGFGPRGPVHEPPWANELMNGYW